MKTSILKYLLATSLLFSGCAYYNTFFNAKKFFKEAEKEREKSSQRQSTSQSSRSESMTTPRGTETVSSSAKQKYDKSIEKASRLLELYPKSKYVDDALFLLGKSFFYQAEYRKAKRKFEELINNFPKSEFVPEARLWLGKTNTQLSDYETAETNFRDILNEKAKQSIKDETQFLLGGLYFHAEDYLRAVAEYKIAAQNAGDKALRSQAYLQLGECYLKLKDYASAASSFEKARKYSPDAETEYNALFKAGLAYKVLEQYDKAIDIFNELLGDIINEDRWPECLLEVADCLYFKGEITNAISWYESITKDHQKTDAAAKAYYQLGYIYQIHKSDYEQALEYYENSAKEYSRSEIVPKANASSKNIQLLLALKDDIKEQEKRIARGDSVAATMDSVAFNTASDQPDRDLMLADSLRADSLRAAGDSLSTASNDQFDNPADRNRFSNPDLSSETDRSADADRFSDPERFANQGDSLRNIPNRMFDRSRDQTSQPNQAQQKERQKFILKKGELGTPKEELIKDKLMLAEIYLFEFNQPDSALFEYLDILNHDSTSEVASKAVYSIGFIYENFKNDSVMTDSIYKELVRIYPNTIYAERAREKLNLPKLEKETDLILREFNKAEKEYADKQNFYAALDHYEKIAVNYPGSEFASKSLYAIGWIYDNDLNENDKALETYQKLVEKYPESSYSKKVKSKIDAFNAEKNKQSEASTSKSKDQASEQTELVEKTPETEDLSQMDKESYFELLRKEMDKDQKRLRNPKRIIK